MRRINLQVDWLPVDALVVSCYSRRLILDFTPNLGKVPKAAPGNVVELGPFLILACYARRCMRNVYFVVGGFVVAFRGKIDELKDEWSPCYDAASSREEISANDVF